MWQSVPYSSVGKESACNAGDPGLIPGLGRSTGEGIGYPLQYSGLENSIDCIVHRVVKSQTDWTTFTFTFHDVAVYHPLLQWEKRTKEKKLTTLRASSSTSPCSTLEPNDISHSPCEFSEKMTLKPLYPELLLKDYLKLTGTTKSSEPVRKQWPPKQSPPSMD